MVCEEAQHARSANLHVLVYIALYTKAPYTVVNTWFTCTVENALMCASGDKTQQDFILFKHKQWSVKQLVYIVGVDGDRDTCTCRWC